MYCEEKDLLHVKLLQFELCRMGYSIRHDRLRPLNCELPDDIPHPYREAKPTEEAANEATNTGRWPEGI